MNKLINFPYQHVLVLGLAKSGTSAAKILLRNGIKVRVNDITLQESKDIDELQEMGVDIITGAHPLSVLDDIDLLIKNPGIPYENIIVDEAVKRKIPIVTEIELINYLIIISVLCVNYSIGITTKNNIICRML